MSDLVEHPDAAPDTRSRRSGGRQARRAIRAAPLADEIRPVRPGLSGGRYKPLGQNDLEQIHEAVLTVLETIGFANAIPSRPSGPWIAQSEIGRASCRERV